VKKTALITGGAGFLGSYLCERLINQGLKVICLDSLITGNLKNIAHLLPNKDFRFIRHDVSNCINIRDKLYFILHFASPASPADYLNYPIPTLKAGSLGTHNTLGLAKAKRARFLLASTSEVYGDPLEHPQKEEYRGNVNCVGPRGVYDEAKRFAEAITMAYQRVHKIDTRIARIFNTFGPRMRKHDGRAIPNFAMQALQNKPITVYGSGLQTRSFCYVDDLIDCIMKLLMAQASASSKGNKDWMHYPVNIGNPYEMRLIDLAKIIIKLSASKSRIQYRPLPVDDPKQRQPDITRARKYLKWSPGVDLKAGLEKTIEWFKSN
jgi:dTDP-glucose 4,6-dehydratase